MPNDKSGAQPVRLDAGGHDVETQTNAAAEHGRDEVLATAVMCARAVPKVRWSCAPGACDDSEIGSKGRPEFRLTNADDARLGRKTRDLTTAKTTRTLKLAASAAVA